MSDLDALTATVMSHLPMRGPARDRVVGRLLDSSRGDRLRPAVADLGERPGSAAHAGVLRAQVLAALAADPLLAVDIADLAGAPRPGGMDVTISHAQNVQVGNHNTQNNHVGGPPVRPRNMILMVSSNPFGTDGLRLDEEYRAVTQAVQMGRHRDRLALVSAPAARYSDIAPNIQQHRPVVVHFGGHGTETGELVVGDDHGRPLEVPMSALADMFGSHAATIRCVVLNGCFTKRLADAIAMHGPCVVGTTRAIPDRLAIEFAGAFYTAVANGRRFDDAFADGRNHLDLADRTGSDAIVLVEGHRGWCGTAL